MIWGCELTMCHKNKDTLKLHYFSSACICQVLPETAPKDSPYERRYDALMEYMCSILDDLPVKMMLPEKFIISSIFFECVL